MDCIESKFVCELIGLPNKKLGYGGTQTLALFLASQTFETAFFYSLSKKYKIDQLDNHEIEN